MAPATALANSTHGQFRQQPRSTVKAGADTMAGGAGNDLYLVDNAGDVITESSGAGTDSVKSSSVTYILGANVENLDARRQRRHQCHRQHAWPTLSPAIPATTCSMV
jgi:hypothetical protein